RPAVIDSSAVLEPLPEPILHTLCERTAGFRGTALTIRLFLRLGVLATPERMQCQQRAGEHDQEAEHAHQRHAAHLQPNRRHAVNEQRDADHEHRDTLYAAALGWTAQLLSSDRGRELGILCIELALDLVE